MQRGGTRKPIHALHATARAKRKSKSTIDMSNHRAQLKQDVFTADATDARPNRAGLGQATQASIGLMLRQYYADLVDAPLPASLMALRRELEERETNGSNADNEEPSLLRQS